MKYKAGDRVLVKSIDWYNKNKNEFGSVPMGQFSFNFCNKHLCGTILTIRRVLGDYYLVKENDAYWTDQMIEGLVEEEDLIPKFGEYSDNEPLDVPTMTTDFVKKHGLPCPEDYIFKDENGNVINATKIVLEKKEGYPKTYKECCKVLGIEGNSLLINTKHITDYERGLWNLMEHFRWLIICRDAYWKIAGEEMGLGKPWKPDWDDDEWPDMYYISFDGKRLEKEKGYPCCNMILIFPTEEMRDAFYENFKEIIEQCKELL